MENKYLTVKEQFKKTLNNDEISRIKNLELREIRMKHWEYRIKIFRDEHNISDSKFSRLTDINYKQEAKELEEYCKRKNI